MTHAGLLAERIRSLGHDPFEHKPLPAQTAMFNALEGLPDTCQRVAGFTGYEERHGSAPRLVLFREYLASLDR
jgi:hypothetical protein